MTWSADLAGQLDFYFTTHLRPRLAGLTDDEYLWEPVAGMWSVRADETGRLRAEFRDPEPPIPPVTTIAWRLDHLTRGVLGKRARAMFGGSPADPDDPDKVADMFDDRHWPEPVPAGAEPALAALDYAYSLWHSGVAGLDDEGLARPLGPRGAMYANDSMAALVLHISREVIAHGAEICLLRDLYQAQSNDRDPLVSAALRGDVTAVRAHNPADARPSLAAEAAGLRHWQVVRALVESGAEFDGALHYAAAAGERDLAEFLVARGASLDAVDDRFGQTPAGWAQYCGHAELAEWLVQAAESSDATGMSGPQ